MRSEVFVRLDAGREYRFGVAEGQAMPHELARIWLDGQFVALGCEPLRATGKVLLADKLIAIAQAAGSQLLDDPQWSAAFASAACAALGRPMVRLDVPAMTVSY